MELIADGLLIGAALTATLYCVVLSRRLRSLSDAGTGIADQIKALDRTLEETRSALRETQTRLGDLKGSAKVATEKLSREVLLANEAQSGLETARGSLERLIARAETCIDTFGPIACAETGSEAHPGGVGRVDDDLDGASLDGIESFDPLSEDPAAIPVADASVLPDRPDHAPQHPPAPPGPDDRRLRVERVAL